MSLCGSLILMFGHGIVSGGLFLLVGMLYDRYKTKLIFYYSGIYQCMPIFSVFFFMFILGNIGMPGTCNFIGESLVFISTLSSLNTVSIIAIASSILLCSFYSLYAYNRITFGFPNRLRIYNDLTVLEFSIILPIFILMLLIGIYPKIFTDTIAMSCYSLSCLYHG
jgi:NADH-quinone oxidoreductase subunit M